METARFLTVPRYRYADYVDWHRQWQETLDPTQFFDQVFGAKPSTTKQGLIRLILSNHVSDGSPD